MRFKKKSAECANGDEESTASKRLTLWASSPLLEFKAPCLETDAAVALASLVDGDAIIGVAADDDVVDAAGDDEWITLLLLFVLFVLF